VSQLECLAFVLSPFFVAEDYTIGAVPLEHFFCGIMIRVLMDFYCLLSGPRPIPPAPFLGFTISRRPDSDRRQWALPSRSLCTVSEIQKGAYLLVHMSPSAVTTSWERPGARVYVA